MKEKTMGNIITKLDLMNNLTEIVTEYAPKCRKSVLRNSHMNKMDNKNPSKQDVIEAILVDFVNYVGAFQGLDWGLYTKDLHKEDI